MGLTEMDLADMDLTDMEFWISMENPFVRVQENCAYNLRQNSEVVSKLRRKVIASLRQSHNRIYPLLPGLPVLMPNYLCVIEHFYR